MGGCASKESIARQRRRLSVAPTHVGDVSGFRKGNSESESVIAAYEAKKYVAITKRGYSPYNKNKKNQDSFFCDLDLDGTGNARLFGVCDGHGEHGHDVSGMVAEKLPKYLKSCDFRADPVQAIKDAVAKMADTLKKASIETTFSGTTMVFSLVIDNQVYTANLGDSRAIIVSEGGDLKAKALSNDHKPELPAERERIVRCGGRVGPIPGMVGDDYGPERVWLKDLDLPGLAMSRSFGDDLVHSIGVTHEPEVTTHTITENDSFMVFASDGVWDFLTNEETATLVQKGLPDLKAAAIELVKESVWRWKREEESIDDITAVICYLKPPSFSVDEQKELRVDSSAELLKVKEEDKQAITL